jgi:hypothetical protein
MFRMRGTPETNINECSDIQCGDLRRYGGIAASFAVSLLRKEQIRGRSVTAK